MMLAIVLVVVGYTVVILYLRHANKKAKKERGEDDG